MIDSLPRASLPLRGFIREQGARGVVGRRVGCLRIYIKRGVRSPMEVHDAVASVLCLLSERSVVQGRHPV